MIHFLKIPWNSMTDSASMTDEEKSRILKSRANKLAQEIKIEEKKMF